MDAQPDICSLALPEFLRALGKEEIKPGGGYATKTAVTRLELRSNEHLLLIGPGAANTAIYVAMTSRVEAVALVADESQRALCDDVQLSRHLSQPLGSPENMPLDNARFDAALIESTLADLEPARQAAVLREVARVLKPGGRVALHELAWRQAPTPEISSRLREIWGAPVYPHVVRGWWDLLESAGFSSVNAELAVISYFTRKGMETDEGDRAVNLFHSAFENPRYFERFTAAYRELQENRRYYGVVIATATRLA